MSDHWNSLADLLGTPSIDPPPKKAAPPKKSERESGRVSFEPESQLNSTNSVTESSESKGIEETTPPPAPPVKPEPPSRLRSSWDTVARLFGVSSSSDFPPAAIEPPKTAAKANNERSSEPEEDLFAGFGRKKERPRDEQVSRTAPPAVTPDREPARPKKKPSSFWDTADSENDNQESTISPSPRAVEADESSSRDTSSRFVSDKDDDGTVPERRGRSRNIRRGRGSETTRDESPREEPEVRRAERSERAPEGNRSSRSDRPERSSRVPQDRAPASERVASSERVSSSDRPASGDRPARDSERRPRNDGRTSRTSDRPGRGEKRTVESDEVQPTRSVERAPRGERPARDDEAQGRSSRGRNARREPSPIEEEGEWDSSEVGFEDSDSSVVERADSELRSDVDEAADPPSRGRRRRRRGGRRPAADAAERSANEEAPSRQAYGRTSTNDESDDDHEEVENLRVHKVTSWLDAISPMIDANMENHKRNPGGDRHRGGSGGSRRRNNNSGSGNR